MAYEQPEAYDDSEASNGSVASVPKEVAEAIANDELGKLVDQQATVEAVRIVGRKRGEKQAAQLEQATRRVKISSLANVPMVQTYWLWRNRIPLGEITLVAGRGGIGKSLVLCTMTAWITTGQMKGEFFDKPRDVIFVANEDSYERTVVPRLAAAGADLERVHRVSLSMEGDVEGKLILPTDCAILAEAVKKVGAVAVFLDPLSSNMTDRDRNSPEVRQSYERLRLFAETSNVAVVGNAHTRKGQSADLLEAIMGSSEIGNVARAAIGVVRDPDSEEPRVILSQCKNNYGPMDLPSFTYTVEERPVPGTYFNAPAIVWGEESERHVNDVLSDPVALTSVSDVKDCGEWVKDWLVVNGKSPRKDVLKAAAAEGYKEHTVKRAAPRAGVVSTYTGFPRVAMWEIPAGTAGTGAVPTVPAGADASSRNTAGAPSRAVPTVPAGGWTQDPYEEEDD